MKKIIAILLALALLLSFSACAKNEKEKEPDLSSESQSENSESLSDISDEPEFSGAEVKIGVLKGPTGMGAAWLMDQNDGGLTLNSYDFTIAGAPDELTGRLIQGDLNIAALPTNAISTLYNKTEGEIVTLGVNALGVLYILERGDSIETVADLEGKTVLASGQGSTAEYVLNYILDKNGVSTEIYWASEHSEAATLALSGDYDVVMLPEPFVTNVTKKDGDFRVALNLSEEWENLGGGVLTMGGIAVRKDFLDENPEAVAEFVKDYANSVAFTNENPAEAAALIEKYEIAPAAVAEAAIPRCNIVWLHGEDYAETLKNFLEIVYEANAAGVGGKLPGDDFYANY